MKEDLIKKFVEKLDYSYNYNTVNERQNIINDLCEIAGIEQLTIPAVVGQRRSEQLIAKEQDSFDKGYTKGWTEGFNSGKVNGD